MKKTAFIVLLGIIMLTGCKKKSDDQTTPTIPVNNQSPMGNVGTTFAVSTSGVSNPYVEITALTNGISVVHATGTVTDPVLLAALLSPSFHESWATIDSSGNFVMNKNVKFTNQDITDYVNNDISRPFTVVNYSWVVGDSTSAYIDKDAIKDSLITRKCIQRSITDDYYDPDLGMYIKTLTITEQHKEYLITYKANEKYGIVYGRLDYGTYYKEATILSSAQNNVSN